MESLATGTVVLVPFPFSDLSHAKLRPALVLAIADHHDHILCQITSNPYTDRGAIPLQRGDFAAGSLPVASYIRPSKLFTASGELIVGVAGRLHLAKLETVLLSVRMIFQQGNSY